MIIFSLCIAKKYNTNTFPIFCCLSWHPPALFCRFKGIILMLQNLPQAETDKSYDKTVNLRELQNFFKRLFRIINYTFCMHSEKRITGISVKSFELTVAVRRFHAYRDIWLPYINKTLKCLHELGNAYDVFGIKCIKGNMIVGDLPREISRATKYLSDQGVIVTATNTSEHYRKSPFFQEGLEIRCVIT